MNQISKTQFVFQILPGHENIISLLLFQIPLFTDISRTDFFTISVRTAADLLPIGFQIEKVAGTRTAQGIRQLRSARCVMAAKSQDSKLDDLVEPIVEPVKNCLAGIEKKVRNLEKKKTKLDNLRDEVKKSGKPLNEDQAVKNSFPGSSPISV